MLLRNLCVGLGLLISLPMMAAELNVTNIVTTGSLATGDSFLVRTGASKALRAVSPAVVMSGTASNAVVAQFVSGNTISNQVAGPGNVRFHGALGNGTANDTAAFASAFSWAAANSKKVTVPAGTYLVDPITMGADYWNFTIEGVGAGLAGAPGIYSTNITRIKARQAQSHVIKVTTASFVTIKGIALDGANVTTNVVWLYGVGGHIDLRDCSVEGTLPLPDASGRLVTIGTDDANNNQMDFCLLENCDIRQEYGTNTCRKAVYVVKSNTIQNTLKKCRVAQADVLVWINGAGDTTIQECDFGQFNIDAIYCQGSGNVNVYQTYSEYAAGEHFFHQADAIWSQGTKPHIFEGLTLNQTAGQGFLFTLDAPVGIFNSRLGCGITANAATTTTNGYVPVIFNNSFVGTNTFAGTAASIMQFGNRNDTNILASSWPTTGLTAYGDTHQTNAFIVGPSGIIESNSVGSLHVTGGHASLTNATVDLEGTNQRINILSGTSSSLMQFINGNGTTYFGTDNSSGGTFSGGNYAAVFWSNNNNLLFGCGGSEKMRFDWATGLVSVKTNLSVLGGNFACAGTASATNGFYTFSPNGTRYKIVVSDGGALSANAE